MLVDEKDCDVFALRKFLERGFNRRDLSLWNDSDTSSQIDEYMQKECTHWHRQ